jgi:NADPH-dependent 2,4-dienoyl-CoA reductase/sulfur reductase-like enzyme
MRLVVIGGSDAGISAALRACELSQDVEATVVVADDFPNFSICGLPFYVSGETPDWHQLAHRTLDELEQTGMRMLLSHTATSIDPSRHEVCVENRDGQTSAVGYDQLVIATGAGPIRPAMPGLDLPCVHVLHTMDDSFRVHDLVATGGIQKATIVGSGYIGLEMADALQRRGVQVTLFGRAETVLPTVDQSLGNRVADELQRHDVTVHAGVAVEGIERGPGARLLVRGTGGTDSAADLVLVAVGVVPDARLAVAAGIETGEKGAIRVDRGMCTNVADVFAAGDCVETWHRVLQSSTYLPLGTTAHKQGRVAGENAVGGKRLFQGSLGTQVVKVFDIAIARTGLRDHEARRAGFDPLTVETEVWDHKAYYPGAQQLSIRVTGDRRSGQLLGAQILGHWQAEVAKRVDVYAAALFAGQSVDAINDLDLSYTPPLGSPWDAVQLAAQAWTAAVKGGPS